ncbi:hypothetical protein HYU19_02130 [Candidatus Woesearchaeota archaeon]|nr:hypothetical protein [Candidatus Woesearchaeota archaeon]
MAGSGKMDRKQDDIAKQQKDSEQGEMQRKKFIRYVLLIKSGVLLIIAALLWIAVKRMRGLVG